MSTKNKIIIVAICVAVLFFFSIIFALVNSFNNTIISGVYIQELNVSKKEENTVKSELEDYIENLNKKNIILKYNEQKYIINMSQLEISYNYDNAVTQAYSLGRGGNIFSNNFNIVKTKLFKKNINIDINFDEKTIEKEINNVYLILDDIEQDSEYYIDGENLVIIKGKKGIKIDEESLKNSIIEEIKKCNIKDCEIEIPIYEKAPEEIDIEKIYNEICRKPENAYIADDGKVYPNVDGIEFDKEEAKEKLKEEQEEYIIPLQITKAQVTLTDLGKDAFPNVLGTFTTRYDATNENRSNNINLSASKINGTIIMPGETFSYNQIVGKRTIDAGYAEAGAYSGGKVVKEVGGGICQVSSTLYNAVLYANLEIVERSNHYFGTSYVNPGRDATVSWGSVDFKFKNDKDYPILVEIVADDGVCKASIKGFEANEYEVVLQTKIQSIINREVKYENNYSMNSGTEIVKQEGSDGYNVDTYKILRKNGAEVSNEKISSDYYHPMHKIIIRGAKQGIVKNSNNEENENILDGLKEDLIQNIS